MVAILPCTLSKPIRRRVLVSTELLETIFAQSASVHAMSVEAAAPNEKDFVTRHPPKIDIAYKDGTRYQISDVATLKEVIPGRGKLIDYVTIESRYGEFTCSIELKTNRSFEPVNVSASGLEDKVSHFVNTITEELTRDTDITVPVRRVWSGTWAVVFATIGWFPVAFPYLTDASKIWGFLMLVSISALILSVPFEILRQKWLPPVAFLWGANGVRANQAKIVSKVFLATIPIGLVINALSTIKI